jgi:OOP family OmpA-OmpF porin
MLISVVCASAFGCASPPPPPPPAAPQPAHRPRVHQETASTFEIIENTLKLPGPIEFETGSDKLRSVSDAPLEVVLDYLTSKPEVTLLRIEGHTDSDGTRASNQILSEKRALVVARWLVEAGIDCHRLLPVGFGQDRLVVPDTSAENKATNRRVAFVNAALLGKPLGDKPTDGGGHVAGDPCQ